MRKFLLLATIAVLWGCSDDDKTTDPGGGTTDSPSVEISALNGDEGSAVYATSATFKVKAQGVESYAYQIEEGKKTDSPAGEVIYAGATEKGGSGINELKEGDNSITIYGLEGNKTYTVFFAFKAGKEYILQSKEITTPAYTRLITPIVIGRDKIKFHIEVDKNTNYRYAVTDYVNYNALREQFGYTDVDFITYGTQAKGPLTAEVSNENELGEFYPGMPYVVLMGECDEDGNPLFTLTDDGGGDLLSQPLPDLLGEYTEDFKEESCTYEGKYARLRFWTEAPEYVENTAKLEILKKTETYVTIAVTPGEGVISYGAGVIEEKEYQNLLAVVGEQGITSCIFYNYTKPFTEPEELTVNNLEVGSTYKLFVISNYNENDYNRQSVLVQDVQITKSTKPASQLEVTFVPSDNPYSVTFNVKALNKDCSGVRYLMNYTADWNSAPFADEQMLMVYGQDVRDEEFLSKVNSAEGYDMTFDSWEDTESKMILQSYNEEEGKSDMYSVTGKSAKETGTPMSSPLFDKLKGTWTASYTYQKGGKQLTNEFPITFTQNADEGPSNVSGMDKTVYDNLLAYWKKTGLNEAAAKAKIEETFNDYKQSAAKYTKKYKDLNRVVGHGFTPLSEKFYSTWDLFCDLTYSSATTDELFYDYGPKLYLQVYKDEETGEDRVILGTYQYAIPPMLAIDNYEHWLLGKNVASNNAYRDVSFPVTLSDDGKQMTIHGVNDPAGSDILYPSVGYFMGSYPFPMFDFTGDGDIVLTKTDTPVASNASRRLFSTINPADVVLKPAHRAGNRFMKTDIPSERSALKRGQTTIQYKPIDEQIKVPANLKRK